MRRYRHLLFDLDGTLTDPKEGITKSVQYALRHFGIEVADPEELTPFIGPPLIGSFMEFYGMSEEQAREALYVYRERFADVGLFENEVLEGIPEMLQRLAADGMILVVASSKPEPYVRRILDHFGITGYFAEIVGSTMDEKLVKKPDIIREALSRLNARGLWDEDKSTVLMIGDRRHDVEGAKECGVDSLGIYTGYAQEGELESAGADHIFRTVEQMTAFLADEDL